MGLGGAGQGLAVVRALPCKGGRAKRQAEEGLSALFCGQHGGF